MSVLGCFHRTIDTYFEDDVFELLFGPEGEAVEYLGSECATWRF